MDENKVELSVAEQAEQAAKDYFRQGLNCAECVLKAFMDTHETGMSEEVLALATGFGGGIGRAQSLCGAISGAVMAVGMAKGRRNPLEKETPRERAQELGTIYPHFAEMVQELEGRYGTMICKELSSPFDEFEGKSRRKNCQEIIGFCAALAARYAEK